MKQIKKYLVLFLLAFSMLVIIGCKEEKEEIITELTILTVNDFHGSFEEDGGKYGIARLAGAFEKEAEEAQATVVVSAGDMFQGTALSNYDHGQTAVEIMNIMKFDAMSLGNHEFDWGYSEVAEYTDGNQANGEANFPFLGCNIIEKATGNMPEGLKAYEIVERGNLKIAIIGFMGANQEDSIAEAMIKDYEFVDPMPIIEKTAADLRTNQGVDVVIVVGHEGNELNYSLAGLSGNSRVDAIVNAHTHATYDGTVKRNDGYKIPYVQAGTAGQKYGKIVLSIDSESKQVTAGTAATVLNVGSRMNSEVSNIVNNLKTETAPVFARVIGVATEKVDRYGGADWAATALNNYAKTDLAFINLGGIRAQAFPINKGENITVSRIYEIMPFDNFLKKVSLKGSVIKTLINSGDLIVSCNVTRNSITGEVFINGVLLDDNKLYTVAAIDYIFDKPEYPFLSGENIINDGTLFRDILIQTVEKDGSIIIPERG